MASPFTTIRSQELAIIWYEYSGPYYHHMRWYMVFQAHPHYSDFIGNWISVSPRQNSDISFTVPYLVIISRKVLSGISGGRFAFLTPSVPYLLCLLVPVTTHRSNGEIPVVPVLCEVRPACVRCWQLLLILAVVDRQLYHTYFFLLKVQLFTHVFDRPIFLGFLVRIRTQACLADRTSLRHILWG